MKATNLLTGVIAGVALGYAIPRFLGAQGVQSTPALCNNGGCMLPAMIISPIGGLMIDGSFGVGLIAGMGGMFMWGLGHAL